GANSVHARDRAASELSEELRKDLQDPNATAVIIAHSHGGNVALRALQDLESMAGRIRVITLATPFLRVVARRSWQVPYGVGLMGGAIGLSALARNHLDCVGDSGSTRQIVAVLAGVAASGVAAFYIVEWLKAVFTNPHAALAIEEKVHYDTKGAAASRMLV